MSRIGSAPIELPSGVEIAIDGTSVKVKGPKGELTQAFADSMVITADNGVVTVARSDENRETKALHGLTRALIANMVVGVSEGYTKQLEMHGVGYRAALKGNDLELQVGFSHPVTYTAPDGISFEVPEPTKIIVSGIDKQQVGQASAEIRRIRPPEPYKGKGIRYADEYVRRKAGKSAVGAGT